MSPPIDYPDALDALDATDIETVVASIRVNYLAHEIRVHDAATLHFSYWDESEHYVATDLLHHLQAAGYSLLHVGHEVAPESGQRQGWMDCRKYAPGERARTLTCPRCEDTFTPVTVAHRITGPGSAYYACPECENRLEAAPPRPAVGDLAGGETR